MNLSVVVGQRMIILGSLLLFAACSGTRNIDSSDRDRTPEIVDDGYELKRADDTNQSKMMVEPNKDHQSNLSLAQMVQRLPGVRMQGGGFVVDGATGSFMSDTRPLFVVNGRTMGTDFSIVNSMVDPKTVVSVSVLKGADATIYGSRGANGVILIRTVR